MCSGPMSHQTSSMDIHAPCLSCGERLAYVCSGFAGGHLLRAYFHCRRCWQTFWRDETPDGGWTALQGGSPARRGGPRRISAVSDEPLSVEP